jgi:hypothetical protein
MSTTQIIQVAERLPLLERFQVIEALHASIKPEMAKKTMPISAEKEEPFELITFDLGQEVHAGRDEIYAVNPLA